MPQARYHYMIDFFFPDTSQVDGVRKEAHRIVASGDSEAIKESEIATIGARPSFGPPVKPKFFRLRKVFRKREEVIYDSSKVPHA